MVTAPDPRKLTAVPETYKLVYIGRRLAALFPKTQPPSSGFDIVFYEPLPQLHYMQWRI